jgi:lipopolysaccharide export system protein LptA
MMTLNTARRFLRTSSLNVLALSLCVLPAAAQSGPAGMSLSGDQPISIQGDRLEVREEEGIAVFTGAVRAQQADTELNSGRLTIHYDKSGGGSVSTGTAAIRRLEMEGKVVLKSPTQTATGDAGSFDMASQVFTLTGKQVVLSEGDNVAVGCKLVVQMDSGKADLEGCKGAGRVQIMINPKSGSGN